MTLVQLRHLLALAEAGSFSRAAAACFVTQPGFSRSIRALEDDLGQPLFDRVGRRAELTPFGRDVLQRARALVTDADELRASGRRAREGAAGRVAIGLGSGPAALLTAPLLLHVATTHPRLRVDLTTGSIALLTQALRERTLDALVFEVRAVQPATDLQVEVLAEMRGAFLCRRGHPLRRRRAPVRFADLRRYPMVSTPLGPEVARGLVEQYGPEAHPDHCVTLRSDDIASLTAVAGRSNSVLLAVRATAPDLAELPLEPRLRASARFGIVTRAGRSAAPALAIVRPLLRQLLHD
jgi:DNA-binding transcriptional LysR family regulator